MLTSFCSLTKTYLPWPRRKTHRMIYCTHPVTSANQKERRRDKTLSHAINVQSLTAAVGESQVVGITPVWYLSITEPRLVRRIIRNVMLLHFRVSRRRREMYCGHARLCVCVSVCLSSAACLHYCRDPDVTWGSGRGCLPVVHYWADLQSVHGFRCYGNITRTCEREMLASTCL